MREKIWVDDSVGLAAEVNKEIERRAKRAEELIGVCGLKPPLESLTLTPKQFKTFCASMSTRERAAVPLLIPDLDSQLSDIGEVTVTRQVFEALSFDIESVEALQACGDLEDYEPTENQ